MDTKSNCKPPAYIDKHSISINGKTEDITREDTETIAQRNDIQDYKSLIDLVSNSVGKFRKFAAKLKIDEHIVDSIESDFVRL